MRLNPFRSLARAISYASLIAALPTNLGIATLGIATLSYAGEASARGAALLARPDAPGPGSRPGGRTRARSGLRPSSPRHRRPL